VRLSSFDGSTPLETFIAKLNNCAECYRWNKRDRLFYLKACLEGPAGQLLWETNSASTEDGVWNSLTTRFGGKKHVELKLYVELKMHRKRDGERLADVCQDIRRLMALGYPGETAKVVESLDRDAFLDDQDDAALCIRILDARPTNLDDALSIACRMKAYSEESTSESDEKTRRKERIFKLEQPVKNETASQLATANAKIRQLEQSLANQTNHLRRLEAETKVWREQMEATNAASTRGKQTWTERASAERNAAADEFGAPTVEPQYPTNQQLQQGPSATTDNFNRGAYGLTKPKRNVGRLTKNLCRLCFGFNHWANECPLKNGHPTQGSINGVEIQDSGTACYLEILLKGSNKRADVNTLALGPNRQWSFALDLQFEACA
jgi:hypothetical protein